MNSANLLRLALAGITIAALAAAATLDALGKAAANEWAATFTFGSLLVGQHLPNPTP